MSKASPLTRYRQLGYPYKGTLAQRRTWLMENCEQARSAWFKSEGYGKKGWLKFLTGLGMREVIRIGPLPDLPEEEIRDMVILQTESLKKTVEGGD